MRRIPVASSNIKSIGYIANGEILEVEFNSGAIYHYFSVPAGVFADFVDAESKGKFFIRNVRDAKYRYERRN